MRLDGTLQHITERPTKDGMQESTESDEEWGLTLDDAKLVVSGLHRLSAEGVLDADTALEGAEVMLQKTTTG